MLVADIPGIIENATSTKAWDLLPQIHGADLDPFLDYEILRKELEAYNPEMLAKPTLVVLNKVDKEGAEHNIAEFRKRYPFDPATLYEVSAFEERGLKELKEGLRLGVLAN